MKDYWQSKEGTFILFCTITSIKAGWEGEDGARVGVVTLNDRTVMKIGGENWTSFRDAFDLWLADRDGFLLAGGSHAMSAEYQIAKKHHDDIMAWLRRSGCWPAGCP